MGLTDNLEKLVAFPTVTNELVAGEECFRYLRKQLGDYDLDVKILRSHGFPSLVATTKPGTKQPKVVLQAHMDVVPAKPACFKMTEKAGKLYGRGVFDMKFAAACYLQLIDDLKSELGSYDFGVMFTSDEEIGGQNGVKMLLNKGYGGSVCILPDSGDNWQIQIGCKGVWIAKLIASGKTAHGSRPWEGDNAIMRLMAGIMDIQKLFGQPAAGKSSLTVSLIEGGQVFNQVPDRAEATLDMRFVSQAECRRFQTRIKRITDKHRLKLAAVAEVECLETDTKQPEVAKFLEVAAAVRGRPVGKTRSLGASDAHYFHHHGIPTVLIRPNGGGAHSDKEWIDKASLLQFYEVLKAYVTEAAKIN